MLRRGFLGLRQHSASLMVENKIIKSYRQLIRTMLTDYAMRGQTMLTEAENTFTDHSLDSLDLLLKWFHHSSLSSSKSPNWFSH